MCKASFAITRNGQADNRRSLRRQKRGEQIKCKNTVLMTTAPLALSVIHHPWAAPRQKLRDLNTFAWPGRWSF